MSLAAVVHEAESLISGATLSPEARMDVFSVLRANKSDTMAFMLAVALEAGVDSKSALRRAAAIYLNVAALQIADDVADGDCDYLDDPEGAGTAAQYILQNVFYSTLLDENISYGALRAVADALASGAGAQNFEIRTRHWSLETARAAAIGFGGAHHEAYFRIVWDGSALEERAREVGWGLGVGVSVASDVRSSDRRYTTLSVVERVSLIDWALGCLEAARRVDLPSIHRAVASLETELVSQLARTQSEHGPLR